MSYILYSILLLLSLTSPTYQKVFPFPYTDPTPCPKYNCIESAAQCAQSSDADATLITLSPICKDNEICVLPEDPTQTVIGTCTSLESSTIRYPGEDCATDADCYNSPTNSFVSKCDQETKKCTGIPQYEKCERTENCLVGYYCSSISHRCEVQKSEYQECTSTFECKNNLLCYGGHCSNILYGLPIGTDINEKEKEEGVPFEYYCEYGLVESGRCAAFGYSNPFYNKNQMKVECKNGEVCDYEFYPLYLGSFSLPCKCGYNEEGKGYCPIPHSVENEQWVKMMNIKRLLVDNECHSKSRYNCYLNDKELKKVNRHAIDDLEKGNVFYKAVGCAKKVLDDTD